MVNVSVAKSLRRHGVLPKTDIFSRIEEPGELKDKPFDLLLVDRWAKQRDRLKEACLRRGMNLENVGIVHADVEMNNYQFGGDELNPKNALVIADRQIRYGRKFREICYELGHRERKFGHNIEPPTFAYFKYAYDENGSLYGFSTMVPIGFELDENKILEDMGKNEYACWSGYDRKKGQVIFSYIVTDKYTGKKKYFSWLEPPFSELNWKINNRPAKY